jgi:hypothetical protein
VPSDSHSNLTHREQKKRPAISLETMKTKPVEPAVENFAFNLATKKTHSFQQWTTGLSDYINARVIAKAFDALDALYQEGKTVHYARCWVLQFDWGTPAKP